MDKVWFGVMSPAQKAHTPRYLFIRKKSNSADDHHGEGYHLWFKGAERCVGDQAADLGQAVSKTRSTEAPAPGDGRRTGMK